MIKPFTRITVGVACLAVGLAPVAALAADDEEDVQPQVHEAQRQVEAAQRQVEIIQQQVADGVRKAVEMAQRQVQLALADVEADEPPEPPEPPEVAVGFDWINSEDHVVNFLGDSSRQVTPPIVVGVLEPEAIADLQEDFMVMSRILNKAVGGTSDRDTHGVFSGIALPVFPGSRRLQSLYLDNYGALFLLNVKYPLAPQPKAKEGEKEKPADDTWEKTRRELFAPRGQSSAVFWKSESKTPKVKYDAQQVEDLKDDILEALKNATNLRGVKPGENVTVVVTGGGAGGSLVVNQVVNIRSTGNKPTSRVVTATPALHDHEAGVRAGSALTIRVRKSDIDAFAKGNLSLDDFRKKATITAY